MTGCVYLIIQAATTYRLLLEQEMVQDGEDKYENFLEAPNTSDYALIEMVGSWH